MLWNHLRCSLFSFFLLLTCFIPNFAVAQNSPEVDSLEALLTQYSQRDTIRIKMLMELARTLERENPGKSVSYAMDAEEIAASINQPLFEADAIQQVGNSYGVLGANLKQRDCYVRARKIYQDNGDARGEVAILNNLATVSIDERNFEYARDYLIKALDMTIASGESRTMMVILNNMGNMYSGKEDFDSALVYYDKAYEVLLQGEPEPFVESVVLTNIANTYASMEQTDRALKMYHECIGRIKAINDLYGLSQLYLNMSNTFSDLGQWDSSLVYLEKGLVFADSISAMELRELLHRDLAALYDTTGRKDLAMKHSAITILLLDTLRMEEAASISEATQMRIEAEQTINQREIDAAKAEIVQQDKLERQRTITIATVICLGLILLLLFFLYLRFRERRNAAMLLETKVQSRTNELSQANQSLQKAMIKIESSNKDLNTFIYRSSHDLRSPLTSIMGLLDILKSNLNDEESLRYVDLVEDRTSHLNRLLAQLIESVDVLATEPKSTEIQVNELWKEIHAGLEASEGYQAVKFELAASDGFALNTDRACIKVILTNLLQNGIDFRDATKGVQSFCKVSFSNAQEGIKIQVSDNGIGMAEEVQKRAFEMFYRGSLQAEGNGNGMGLYTAKKVVSLIGGQISLESKLGKGTEVDVLVPRLS